MDIDNNTFVCYHRFDGGSLLGCISKKEFHSFIVDIIKKHNIKGYFLHSISDAEI